MPTSLRQGPAAGADTQAGPAAGGCVVATRGRGRGRGRVRREPGCGSGGSRIASQQEKARSFHGLCRAVQLRRGGTSRHRNVSRVTETAITGVKISRIVILFARE